MKSGKRKTITEIGLYRKTCHGCATEVDNIICRMPYKHMLKCPCKNCLVKVTCTEYCEEFQRVKLREQLKNEKAMSGMFKDRKMSSSK